MPAPKLGALGMAFAVTRGLQMACLIAIIGVTANFIANGVATNVNLLVGTISVTCIATIYCFITYILYHDGILPFLVNTGIDGLFLIAVIVVAVTVGKPLSPLNCTAIGSTPAIDDIATTPGYVLNERAINHTLGRNKWMGSSRSTCLELKSIWGLSIALCIFFAFSALCSALLWRRTKNPPKDFDGA